MIVANLIISDRTFQMCYVLKRDYDTPANL